MSEQYIRGGASERSPLPLDIQGDILSTLIKEAKERANLPAVVDTSAHLSAIVDKSDNMLAGLDSSIHDNIEQLDEEGTSPSQVLNSSVDNSTEQAIIQSQLEKRKKRIHHLNNKIQETKKELELASQKPPLWKRLLGLGRQQQSIYRRDKLGRTLKGLEHNYKWELEQYKSESKEQDRLTILKKAA